MYGNVPKYLIVSVIMCLGLNYDASIFVQSRTLRSIALNIDSKSVLPKKF